MQFDTRNQEHKKYNSNSCKPEGVARIIHSYIFNTLKIVHVSGPCESVLTSGRATVLLVCHTLSSRFSTFGEPLEFLLVDRENP